MEADLAEWIEGRREGRDGGREGGGREKRWEGEVGKMEKRGA